MTVVAGSDPSVSLYTRSRESSFSRKPSRSRLPLAIASIAAIGITAGLVAAAQLDNGAAPAPYGPVRGEFRLAPGNQEPPGIVIPLRSQGAVPGEFRLGPGNAQPPGVVAPQAPATGPVRGEFRLAPGNQEPLGVVIPLDSQGPVPGEFRLGPGNALPPGVVVPLP